MKRLRATVLGVGLAIGMCACSVARADLIPSADGTTVYDTELKVTWLADANFPKEMPFDVAINADGSMTYAQALQWVGDLNAMNGGAGYLGHNNWTLPVTPLTDSTCSLTGPNGNFGYSCTNSAFGALYNLPQSLGLSFPDTAVTIPANTVGPFHNLQPYLYWSDTSNGRGTGSGDGGFYAFSFTSGWLGGNVNQHYMYAWPMIQGQVAGTYVSAGVGQLLVSSDGNFVYDPGNGVTWLADADLAMTMGFGVQCTNNDGTMCINADGSMQHDTAEAWIIGMNTHKSGAGYLGQTTWQLPPTAPDDQACSPAYLCDVSPMGELFYDQLRLTPGEDAVAAPAVAVGPFINVQPYLYWSCEGAAVYTAPAPCFAKGPANGFEYSFSFGNGLEGTDVLARGLFVMVYFPDRIFADGFE